MCDLVDDVRTEIINYVNTKKPPIDRRFFRVSMAVDTN